MTLTLVNADEKSDMLCDVTVPEKYYDRILTGIQLVDLVFGGDETPGILPGSATMLTGVPGSGKTTFALQLSDALSRHAGKGLLYNANEESKPMVKLTADRIGIAARFQVAQVHSIDALVKRVLDEGIEVLVQDSLQTLQDGSLTKQNLLASVTRKLVRLSKDHDVTVLVIGQVTKTGQASGPMALLHEVDAHLHIGRDKKTGNRFLNMMKNRFGPADQPLEVALSAHGLDLRRMESAEDADGVGQNKQAARRDEVKAIIRKLLMDGEFVSGYDFERLGVQCSGGFWRGMLRLTVADMEREGLPMGEAKIGGRTHSFVMVGDDTETKQ